MTARFDVDELVAACRAAVAGTDGQRAVREIVERAMAEPGAVAAALAEPEHAGLEALYRADDLTVIHFTWAPWMSLRPHNHSMWSIVGIFCGREDNVFWRRTEGSIEAAGARSLGAGDVTVLGQDIIHSVTNPIGKRTRAIHVYGGDFFAPPRPRSQWDHETLIECPWDLDDARRQFALAEARARGSLSP